MQASKEIERNLELAVQGVILVTKLNIMDQKLITHITPTISLFADNYQYILVIKANEAQAMRNGDHTYHSTIGACFEEVLRHMTKLNLADGKDKTMKEIAQVVENTVVEIRELLKPFEELPSPKKH